ncbi:hypothetical protein F4779DRAFT_573675 [Xylariaceae sp. FL0662B]|nr:hypothetical protein F4779DRAFT_573675 [Xylariaceae sp. FL0662B]
MTQPVYNIDDPEMPAKLLHHPPGPGSFSCRFSAIPFGEPAADLTQYGQIDHECENRLEIRMPFEYHDRLFELQQAWVTKYLDNGVECIMSVGPPIPNKDYTVIIERVHTAACTGMGRELWRIPETPSEEGGW